MGLDMYLEGERFNSQVCLKTGDNHEARPKQDGFPVSKTVLEIGYWRKHPNLHGYIVQTFADGKDECQRISLGAADCRKISTAILEDELPPTAGCFFGDSDWHKDDVQVNAKVFSDAAQWLDDGDWTRSGFYQASW